MKLLIPTLLLTTAALAVPAPASNTATCSLNYESFFGTWTVHVGRPYSNGKGCDFVREKFHGHVLVSSSPGFQCSYAGDGSTRLEFSTNVATSAKDVNAALQAGYPMIPFVAGNVCWEYQP